MNLSISDIANRLNRSPKTIYNHVLNVVKKVDAKYSRDLLTPY
ncbi:TPA: hypothetical protein RQO69_002788 [Klebsiella oxytoca]|nr:hypothetical protein [Klebsiella pneumoniae]HDX9080705.1 hypothetical protein [Klebsiella oxytoca]